MPKVNKIQTSFNAGEISKQAYGHVDNPRYEQGLVYCQNYMPLIQGPLTRRPGTKYVSFVKDSTKLPVLIPFQFSQSQNYVLEFGDRYLRFYQNEGQIVANTTFFVVEGLYSGVNPLGVTTGAIPTAGVRFTALRSNTFAGQNERVNSSVVLAAGSALELTTPYLYQDLQKIKYTQKQDTLYLTHPNYSPMKLVRTGTNLWDLKQIWFQDGPYLPLNSYQTIADQANTTFTAYERTSAVPIVSQPSGLAVAGNTNITIVAGSSVQILTATSAPDGSIRLVTSTSHGFSNGAKICVFNVFGTSEANNVWTPGFATASSFPSVFSNITNSSPQQAYWVASNVTATTIDLAGSTYQHTFITASGVPAATLCPAIFQLTPIPNSSSFIWADIISNSSSIFTNVNYGNGDLYIGGRTIGLYDPTVASRLSGRIQKVFNAAAANVVLDAGNPVVNTGAANNTQMLVTKWSLGTWNNQAGFPSACTFHQDRLVFSGPSAYPQEIDGSMTGQYEIFSASGSNLVVSNNNAVQFNLNSNDLNQIKWLLSSPLGLLAGTQAGEWAVTPSTQNAALSPTNIKADQVTAFGSADSQAVFVGNAALYIQRAQRKVRELLYYWQVGNFRSTNLSDLSQHITVPSVSKIVSMKEPNAFVWAIRSDGNLLSLTYNRDDVTLQANSGWARHVLGGRSDASGSPPTVNSLAVIPSGDTSFDELWLVTQRYLNGSTMGCVEYMTKPFDDYQAQETSVHLDCAGQFSSSIVVTNLTVAGSCVVTAPNHGLTNSSTIRFYNTVGMNITSTDINGLVNSSNPLNYSTFVVTSVSTNSFFIRDFNGNYINTNSCSVYIGSAVVNQLITSISGITWLAGETVSVVADGGIHVNTSVSLSGVLNLSYPAAKVNFGYAYNSDAQMLRTHEGSAQGTSIGTTRRVNRVAFMLHNVGDFSFGPTFTRLIPAELFSADAGLSDVAPTLFDGIYRDGIESDYGFDDTICWRQSSGLPGMIQSVTRFLEEQDV